MPDVTIPLGDIPAPPNQGKVEKPSKTETQNATRDNLNEAGLIKEMILYTIDYVGLNKK